ncbi:MAG TPA: hypothetical protein VEH81_02740 [Ktedonobacteraceae bacterium]|nr:hypothetical protein [Ktedonobacteraceae bacterium]
MGKQTSRQSSKQRQSENKQSSNQNSKQSPANKQTASGSVKQSNSATKQPTRQAMKQERREEERRRQLQAKRRAERNKRILIGSLIAVAVLLVGTVSFIVYSNTHKTAALNQATPAEAVFDPAYPPVDGVYCDQLEQIAYHHHVHLTIYINGQQVAFPAGMGIAGGQASPTCFYWLHTHATDGVIHIEAPAEHSFSLKNFLDIWQNFASSNSQYTFPSQLALPDGWIMYVNGKKVAGDFSKIDISSNQAWHELITLIYNSPNAKPDMPGSYNWQPGQ